MTPERAASVFRELMQTPREEYGHFARRAGLHTQPEHLDLEQAQELLFVIAQALESSPGPNWERVRSAWMGLRARHGQGPLAVPQSAGLEPKPPAWVRNLPPKPMLGDPAPGTAGHEAQQERRARFVPTAQPAHAPAPPPAAAPLPVPHAAPPATYVASPAQYPVAPAAQYPVAPAAQYPAALAAQYPAAPAAYGESYASSPRAAAPPAPSPEDAGWTVSKYAAFCAACAAFPDRVLQTQQQYGLADATARARLDDWWANRFDDDPGLQEQWERMFSQFREQLRRQG